VQAQRMNFSELMESHKRHISLERESNNSVTILYCELTLTREALGSD